MNKITPLTAKEERELLKAAKPVITIFLAINNLQKEIAEKENNTKNKQIAPGEIEKLKSGRKVDREELKAEGTSSLIKAVEKFDLNSKNKFSTYAGSGTKEKSVIYYDSNYQNDDKESKSYSLMETLHDDENAELTAEQVRHQDTTIQINNLINALGNREEILLVRLLSKISKILGKSENTARRLKQEAFKKLQKLAKERNLHFLIR
ncbi:4043_t:CDS:2 [Paraglomus brasilianum]|uniref:4043_t:CDS:1 n=1 Tax=Paraglomus brasilianum TaxID=144538 RepID=A0A9N8VW33_9GLOM|nr:4043_t:CDS:2 [Paraglomus brasilianum]